MKDIDSVEHLILGNGEPRAVKLHSNETDVKRSIVGDENRIGNEIEESRKDIFRCRRSGYHCIADVVDSDSIFRNLSLRIDELLECARWFFAQPEPNSPYFNQAIGEGPEASSLGVECDQRAVAKEQAV